LLATARYAAAVLLGLQQVPVIEVEGLSEAKRRALALADPTKNHPGELHDSELEIIRIGSARTRAACRQGAKLESGDKMAATHLNKNAASKRLLLANDLYHLLPDKSVSKYVRVHMKIDAAAN
jgi:hypothetical protein